MNEDEAWALFTGKIMDEDKVSPEKRSGKDAGISMTDERAIGKLCRRIGEARQKHPQFARDQYEAYSVIYLETCELRDAVGNREPRERQIDEALDVAATCMRFVMGEYEHAR